MRWPIARRRPPRPAWEIKVSTPDGELLSIDTEQLYAVWLLTPRSVDGYVDLLELYGPDGRIPRIRLWVKPRDWTEPDERLAALDGTDALPDALRRSR